MNIKPEFRTSPQWKKFKKAIGHPAAMEFFVNIGCELEGTTRASKQDNGFIDTKDPEDFLYLCGAEDYGIEGEALIEAFLSSGLMVVEEDRFRLISWEEQNVGLFNSRANGRRGGRPIETEGNGTELKGNVNSNQNDKGNKNETIKATEPNLTEHNVTERNVTGGLPHANLQVTQTEPTGNPDPTRTQPTGNPGLGKVTEEDLREVPF
jgi:hypothetical protein